MGETSIARPARPGPADRCALGGGGTSAAPPPLPSRRKRFEGCSSRRGGVLVSSAARCMLPLLLLLMLLALLEMLLLKGAGPTTAASCGGLLGAAGSGSTVRMKTALSLASTPQRDCGSRRCSWGWPRAASSWFLRPAAAEQAAGRQMAGSFTTTC